MPDHTSITIDRDTAPDLVEEEDTGTRTWHDKPWNPAKIRITTKNFSLREVVEQIRDGEIDLAPDFQREYVWKRRQRTRLIESILLGIPLPAFYFNQDDDGNFQVVDGVQRLSTIAKFMDNEHSLEGADLEYLFNLQNHRHDDLDTASLRRFRTTQIVVHVIEPQTPDDVKYDIFGRVNTLGSPLSAQEIRHAMSKHTSRKFLLELTELPSFDLATGNNFWKSDQSNPGSRVRDTGRMMNRELALRFCAFLDFDLGQYKAYSSLNSYLAEHTKRIDNRSTINVGFDQNELNRIKDSFDRAMKNSHFVLDNKAFRRISSQRRGQINRAIFESQAIALSRYTLSELTPHKTKIQSSLLELFTDENYLKSVTVSTGDARRVQTRLEMSAAVLERILP